MMARLATLLLAVAFVTAAAAQIPPVNWPPLPAKGFVSGRPATDEDVKAGNAVFVLKAYGTYFGRPMNVTIPQYAYFTKSGEKPEPVIVVQAEIGKGIKLFGVRDFDGHAATARDYEIRLLGTASPH